MTDPATLRTLAEAAIAERKTNAVYFGSPADKDYIAAANPTTILALLDRLAKAEEGEGADWHYCDCDSPHHAGHPDTLAERDALRAALTDAVELAEEGWAYAGDFFQKKWESADRLGAARAALEGRP